MDFNPVGMKAFHTSERSPFLLLAVCTTLAAPDLGPIAIEKDDGRVLIVDDIVAAWAGGQMSRHYSRAVVPGRQGDVITVVFALGKSRCRGRLAFVLLCWLLRRQLSVWSICRIPSRACERLRQLLALHQHAATV